MDDRLIRNLEIDGQPGKLYAPTIITGLSESEDFATLKEGLKEIAPIADIVESDTVTTVTKYPNTGGEWTSGAKYYDGTEYTSENFSTYHFRYFDVREGDVFTLSTYYNFRDICEFNGDSVVTATRITGVTTYTVPSGVTRVALTTNKNCQWIYQQSTFAKLSVTKDALKKNAPSVVEDTLETLEGYVSPRSTTFFYISGNLVNPSTIVEGEYVDQNNGAFAENSQHERTGYVAVEPDESYCIRASSDVDSTQIRYVFYDSEKAYITGQVTLLGAIGYVVTAPSNAAFIVISKAGREQMMIKKSAVKVDFESYDTAYVMPQYIVETSDSLINLPSKLYALVGYELNVYFENLMEDYTKYHWNVDCAKGMQLERGYRVTPVSGDEGTYTLTITISNGNFKKSVETSLIITSDSAGSGTTKTLIVLGDSTTNNGIAVTKLNANFANDVMSISTIGTRGTAPNNHEGRSGWTFRSYFNPPNSGDVGVENPWYNPTTQTFDADYYFTNSGIAKPDWLFINLGINDVFSYTTDNQLDTAMTTIKSQCATMIESIQSASPDTKIGLCLTIPPNHSQDAFGKAYKCNQTRDRYKRNNTLWVHDLIELYDNREADGIWLIPIYTNLDTVYNMGFETLPVNARNTAITYQSPIQNGGVHPVDSGYWQIADVYAAFLKAQV